MPSASSAVTARRQDPGASGDPAKTAVSVNVTNVPAAWRAPYQNEARTVSERPHPAASITYKTVMRRSSDRTPIPVLPCTDDHDQGPGTCAKASVGQSSNPRLQSAGARPFRE
jgi:hypothetical protein